MNLKNLTFRIQKFHRYLWPIVLTFLVISNLYAISNRLPNNTGNCNELINVLFDKSKGYEAYEFSQKQIEKSSKQLKTIQASYRNNEVLDDAYIDSDGYLHKMGRGYEVRFNSKEYDLISIFGPPVKKRNQFYVNFKLLRKGLKNHIGKEDQIIRRMPLHDFYELTQESFFKWDIKPSEYIILKSNKSGQGKNSKDVFEILEIGHNKIKARSLDGKIRWISRQKVFFENMGITHEERTLLNKFFSHGGQGSVIYHNFKDHLSYKKSGIYIQISTIPNGGDFNSETLKVLQENLDKGINFLLTTNEHGIGGAFVPKSNSIIQNLSKSLKIDADNYIIITPNMDDSFIVHEVRHYDDFTEGKRSIIIDFLKENFSDENNHTYSNKDLLPFFHIIGEQRAYATQANYLRSKKIQTRVIEGFFEDKEVPYSEWLDNFIQNQVDIYETRYRKPYQSFLKKLKLHDHQLADKVESFLRTRFIESEDFN